MRKIKVINGNSKKNYKAFTKITGKKKKRT